MRIRKGWRSRRPSVSKLSLAAGSRRASAEGPRHGSEAIGWSGNRAWFSRRHRAKGARRAGFACFVNSRGASSSWGASVSGTGRGLRRRSSCGDSRATGWPCRCFRVTQPAAVAAIGAEIGVRDVEGGLLPDQKLAAVDRLRDRYGPVAMVGDGINDAPALARADVGIAFSEGTEIAREAAAVTLMRPDLRLVSVALRIARRALRIIRQNLFWAFFYNLAAVPLAAGILYPSTGVLLPPEAAAAAMALSSLSVVGNALRLKAGD